MPNNSFIHVLDAMEPVFGGRAGSVLSRVIAKVGTREDFHFVTMPDEIDGHGVIIALGDDSLRTLTGVTIPIAMARGYRFESDFGPVIPTFHPSYLGRGKMNLIPIMIWDFLRAQKEIGLDPVEFPMSDLELWPEPSEFQRWGTRALRESRFLVHDIETAYGSRLDDEDEMDLEQRDASFRILRFSLADDQCRAITAPFQEPFISMWKVLMGDPVLDKIGWNSNDFDDPREAANGIETRGQRIDAQWLWNFLQKTLPRGLGLVSTFYDRVPEWKSFGSSQLSKQAELYSAMDARQTAKNYLGIRKALEARTL